MNTNDHIQKAKRDNERKLLLRIKQLNRRGEEYRPYLASIAGFNALDRLQEKGLVRFARVGWCGGYIATAPSVVKAWRKARRAS